MEEQEKTLKFCFAAIWVDFVLLCGRLWQTWLEIVWSLNGVSARWECARSGKEKDNTAQVMRNWYSFKFTNIATPYSFIMTHERFTTPDIIWRNNVQLLRISQTEATFTELDEQIDLLNLRRYPLFFTPQTSRCRRIIRIPRHVFQKMMDDIDIADREVVWLFNTQRCGSTTWAQIFNALPNWSVLSEPQAIYQCIVNGQTGNNIPAFTETKEFEDILRCVVKMYSHLIPKGNAILWKTMPVDEPMLKVIPRVFPHHKLLFAYRNSLANAKSYHKSFISWPLVLNYIRHLELDPYNTSPTGQLRVARLVFNNGYDVDLCAQAIRMAGIQPVMMEWYVLTWAAKLRAVLDAKQEGIVIKPIKYENMLTDLERCVRKVFMYLNVSLDLLPIALEAAQAESLEGTALSRSSKSCNQPWKRSKERVERCNKVLSVFGLPDVDTDYVMDGSI